MYFIMNCINALLDMIGRTTNENIQGDSIQPIAIQGNTTNNLPINNTEVDYTVPLREVDISNHGDQDGCFPNVTKKIIYHAAHRDYEVIEEGVVEQPELIRYFKRLEEDLKKQSETTPRVNKLLQKFKEINNNYLPTGTVNVTLELYYHVDMGMAEENHATSILYKNITCQDLIKLIASLPDHIYAYLYTLDFDKNESSQLFELIKHIPSPIYCAGLTSYKYQPRQIMERIQKTIQANIQLSILQGVSYISNDYSEVNTAHRTATEYVHIVNSIGQFLAPGPRFFPMYSLQESHNKGDEVAVLSRQCS